MCKKPYIQVGAALIIKGEHYLIARRKRHVHLGGLWEFPGGKCEDGEELEECVRREVLEELGLEVTQPVFLMAHIYEYNEKTVNLNFFQCSILQGEPKALDCADFRWVKPEEFCEYEFPPGDAPVINMLLQQANL